MLRLLSDYERRLLQEGQRIARVREAVISSFNATGHSSHGIDREDASLSAPTPPAYLTYQHLDDAELPIAHHLHGDGFTERFQTSGAVSTNRLNETTSTPASELPITQPVIHHFDMVCGVLNKHGEMTNPQIIEAVQRHYGRVLSRESLSVQLSKWATAGQVQRNGRLWKLVEREPEA
jgi:hypothetical protein